MDKKIKILGIVGSIHYGSFNRILMETAKNICPTDKAEIEIIDIKEFGIFDRGNEEPKNVTEMKNKIRAVDAVLIATPEYNYSIPGVLKNFIDWMSYPSDGNCFWGKPIAIMSGSTGIFGGVRAQLNLRQIFITLNGLVLQKPEVMVPSISEKVLENKLVDQETIDKIKKLVEALIDWTQKIGIKQ